ncbi:glycine-rich protein 1-like [Anopheles bellator]|uniref:glycine-rich protein 1-like n=1 Tax=Anopheles bellator TaxID=139047 RepID=UPI002649155A|nr:glycine-rich protein 1-like [Anopheles bellator]
MRVSSPDAFTVALLWPCVVIAFCGVDIHGFIFPGNVTLPLHGQRWWLRDRRNGMGKPSLGDGGFSRGFQPNFFNSQPGVLNRFSGAGASSNALSQNFGGAGFSSSNANADAFSQSFGLGQGAGASAANAQAQSFQAGGPFGSFGASAANAASQGFSAGPDGLSGSASFAGSQTYNFPGDHKISLAYSNGFSLANGQPSGSNGFSISESK